MLVQDWADIVVGSLQDLWLGVVGFVPSLIGALIIFILGLIVATGLGSLVERLVRYLKVDNLLSQMGLHPYFERAGLKIDSGRFFGQIVFWFLTIAFLLAASDILGFFALSGFLRDVLFYIPNILVAALIILASVVLANFLRTVIKASVMSAKLHAAKFLGSLAWWASVVFGFLAAMVQLGIAVSIINTIITGLVAMFAIAGGIAFGLGGKEYAAHLLEKFRDQIEE